MNEWEGLYKDVYLKKLPRFINKRELEGLYLKKLPRLIN